MEWCDIDEFTVTADVVAFLRARLDERQRIAEDAATAVRRWPKANPAPWDRARLVVANMQAEFKGHARRAVALDAFEGRESPADVLAEVAAKRAILDRLVHDGGWELRHGVEGDEIVTYYWSTCSCGWEQEVYRSGDIEHAHDQHRESVGYNEAVARDVVRLLVRPYSGHPQFHPSWAAPVTPTQPRSEYRA